LLDEAALDAAHLPVVIRYDGQVIIDPSLPDLARAIGVSVKNDIESCELAIVGAGPAGLTAAVYAASEGLETVLLELAVSGGRAVHHDRRRTTHTCAWCTSTCTKTSPERRISRRADAVGR